MSFIITPVVISIHQGRTHPIPGCCTPPLGSGARSSLLIRAVDPSPRISHRFPSGEIIMKLAPTFSADYPGGMYGNVLSNYGHLPTPWPGLPHEKKTIVVQSLRAGPGHNHEAGTGVPGSRRCSRVSISVIPV